MESSRRRFLALGGAAFLQGVAASYGCDFSSNLRKMRIDGAKTFGEFTAKTPSVVTIGGEWCGPCIALEKYFDMAHKDFFDVNFYLFDLPHDDEQLWNAADKRFGLRDHFAAVGVPIILVNENRFFKGYDAATGETKEYTTSRYDGEIRNLPAIIKGLQGSR